MLSTDARRAFRRLRLVGVALDCRFDALHVNVGISALLQHVRDFHDVIYIGACDALAVDSRSPHGGRGLKCGGEDIYRQSGGRSPHGGRGLK